MGVVLRHRDEGGCRRQPEFLALAAIYMCARLMTNIVQVGALRIGLEDSKILRPVPVPWLLDDPDSPF